MGLHELRQKHGSDWIYTPEGCAIVQKGKIKVLLILLAVVAAISFLGCECGAQKSKRVWKATPEHVVKCFQGGNSIATYCCNRLVDLSDGRQKCMRQRERVTFNGGKWHWLPQNATCVLHTQMCKQEVVQHKPKRETQRKGACHEDQSQEIPQPTNEEAWSGSNLPRAAISGAAHALTKQSGACAAREGRAGCPGHHLSGNTRKPGV